MPSALASAEATFLAAKCDDPRAAHDWHRTLVGALPRLEDAFPEPFVIPDEWLTEAGVTPPSIWDERPILRHLHTFAQARMVAPTAVLGAVLARVVVATPPSVVLPPLVGGDASLNVFVALVGASGTGKGAAERVAAEALDIRSADITTSPVGSGEGIGHLYAHREKGEVVRDRDAVLFTIPEVDNLTALGNRQGATLLPQLRQAWSGESLGFSYADKSKSLPIHAHTYRMGLLIGVQPGRAAALLDDADGGTPQRFLWLSTTDPTAPDITPEAPAPMVWNMASARWTSTRQDGRHVLPVPDVARREVQESRRSRLRGETGGLDGHELLARLKVAAALMLLDQRREVTEDDWRIAGRVMEESKATREAVSRELRDRSSEANAYRGKMEAARAVTVADSVEADAVRKCAQAVKRRLADGPLTSSELRRREKSTRRGYLDDALSALVDAGEIVAEPTADTRGNGLRYRLAG